MRFYDNFATNALVVGPVQVWPGMMACEVTAQEVNDSKAGAIDACSKSLTILSRAIDTRGGWHLEDSLHGLGQQLANDSCSLRAKYVAN
ncbi:hypothetical protein RRF57_003294 [Xylaria bambusicola]|uniref:Uncharacterized protein n=1 Tax=Xylaria bambusicola TaxID=326684 RepID=A0AAN7UEJ3_9PEZI